MSEITTSELLEHCASCIDDAEDIELIMAHDAALRAKLAAYETAGDIYQAYTDLRAKLAQVEQYLEAQRQATYQAVAREHEAKQRVAELEKQVQWDIQDSCELEREMENLGMVCYDDYGALHPPEVLRTFMTAKDAEIARLKHEISQLLFFTPHGGQ